MILKWGSYAHGQNEVGVKIRKRGMFDQFQRQIGVQEEWHIVGNVKASTQAGITTKLAALEAAYTGQNKDCKDLVLYLDDGTTKTQHQIDNSGTFGGTHVVDFGYMSGPWKMGTEYSNRRSFYVIIRGETRWGNVSDVYSYRERFKQVGTGATRWSMMHSLNILPVPQALNMYTSSKYVQQGVMVCRGQYPTVPAAYYPALVHGDLTQIEYLTPEEIRWGTSSESQNTQSEMWGVRWTYFMEGSVSQAFSGFTTITM